MNEQEHPSRPSPSGKPQPPSTAAEFARRLSTGQQALTVALGAVVDVGAGLAALAAQPHVTTACDNGLHVLCLAVCNCRDCNAVCECVCHKALLRAAQG